MLYRRLTEEQSYQVHGGDKRVAALTPYIVGVWLDSMFMGIIVMLFVLWFIKTRPTERPIFAYLVYYLVAATLAGTMWYIIQIMEAFAKDFGLYINIGSIKYVKWFGLISTATRIPTILFLLHRAWVLWGRRKLIVIVIAPMLVVITTSNIVSIAMLRTLADAPVAKRFLAVAAATEVVADFTLTICIAIRLKQMKSGFAGTDRLITKMVRTLVETQAPQAGTALLFLIMSTRFARTPKQFLVLFYPKIGVICTLIVLISRTSLEQQQREGQFANRSASHPSGSAAGVGMGGSQKEVNASRIALRSTESKHALA